MINNFKKTKDTTLKKMEKPAKIPKQAGVPILKPSTVIRLGTPGDSSKVKNSFLTRASNAYLIGDKY